MNKSVAARLAERHSLEGIDRQIGWIDARNPTRSRAGLLKLAIEQGFESPVAEKSDQKGRGSEADPTPGYADFDNDRRDAHRERVFGQYLEFLKAEEMRLAESDPECYADFVARREKDRAAAAKSGKPWFDNAYFQTFDGVNARLGALQKLFQLPDFWAWDCNQNPDSYESLAAQINLFQKTPLRTEP